MKDRTIKIIYSTVLILVSLLIWGRIYQAQFLKYDDNFGNLISAVVLSITSCVILLISWFVRKSLIKSCRWQTIIFLFISSPITVLVFVLNYEEILGVKLNI